jgi:AcrR family transcriptional regulator
MRSAPSSSPKVPTPGPGDDRTTKARIRDAAVARFAAEGVAAASVRAIAADAGVSPALVIHHFGSKDGLRAACDEHVAAAVRQLKHAAAAAGLGIDPLAALGEADDGPPITRYLARTLADGSPQVSALLDELVADAIVYHAEMEAAGLMRPTKYPLGRAAVLTVWSLGAVVLHEHLERLIGVDITAHPSDASALRDYVAPVIEILGNGVITKEVAARYERAFFDDAPGQSRADESRDPSDESRDRPDEARNQQDEADT